MNLITETKSNCSFELVKNYFDWNIEKKDLFVKSMEEDNLWPVLNFKGICRSDNNRTLGIVQKNYSVINNDIILKTLEPYIKNDILEISSYTSDKGGAVNYINLMHPEQIKTKNDPSPLRFGLSCIWGHNGHKGISFLPFLGRLLCNNGMSTEGIFNPFSYKHSLNLPSKIPFIRQLLNTKLKNLNSNVEKIINQAEAYQKHEMSFDMNILAYKNYYLLSRNMSPKYFENEMSNTQFTYLHNEKATFKSLVISYQDELKQNSLWATYNAFTQMITQPDVKNSKKQQLKLITRNTNIEKKLNIAKNVCDSFLKQAA